MIYLNDKDVNQLNKDWASNVKIIEAATQCIGANDTVQPIKPYLRYGDLTNRIIAMPAFVGGNINTSGIKWIASFPNNIQKGIARAHSVIVLNEAGTGQPVGIINSGAISAIRTSSVSGFVMKQFIESRDAKGLKVGIVGFGPIGQYHLNMCGAIFNDKIDQVYLHDLREVDTSIIDSNIREKVKLVDSWNAAYEDADIFITCTVSKDRYIDQQPKPGSLHLNVSLRDYKPDVYQWFKQAMVVDDWEEVCRENTDIEAFHKTHGLTEDNTKSIQDLLTPDFFDSLSPDQPIMFNPMGMAAYDIAIASHYLNKARETKSGVLLQG